MSQPITSVRWIQVRNTDTVPVPPFGAMEIAGPIDDEGTVPITRPTKDGQTDVIFNWIGMIPAGGVGQGHQAFPTVAGYSVDNEEGLPPSDGEIWGTKTDEWLLSRERTGFRIVGDGVDGLCNIVRMTANLVLMVQITSTTPNDGRYPAQERYYDPVAKTWTTGNACWWVDANGAAARTNRYYLPMLAGYANGRKVYQSAGGGADASDLIDISGRSGSVADVTAAQFLNAVVSGTSDATVITPDVASESLSGIVSTGTQTIAGDKTFTGILTTSNVFVAKGTAGHEIDGTVYRRAAYGTGDLITESISDGSSYLYIEVDGSFAPAGFYFFDPVLDVDFGIGAGGDGALIAHEFVAGPTGGFSVMPTGDGVFSHRLTGATGTSGGGDAVTGGIITGLGSGPSGIDGGTF